ncbi:hypothetical protein OSB04_004690 [Centaurea solstitialis]|uniref:Uncharacterized protein n=1 Tax=Centaurea solstitialis TaxID=347529 RepID=A0AA38TEK5_9ASTR|nr:hypothetical protein OSB04_004690 [Centaurea solstitialis]
MQYNKGNTTKFKRSTSILKMIGVSSAIMLLAASPAPMIYPCEVQTIDTYIHACCVWYVGQDRTGWDKTVCPTFGAAWDRTGIHCPTFGATWTRQKLGQVVAAAATGSHYRPPSPCLPLQQPPPPLQQPPPPPLHLYNCL